MACARVSRAGVGRHIAFATAVLLLEGTFLSLSERSCRPPAPDRFPGDLTRGKGGGGGGQPVQLSNVSSQPEALQANAPPVPVKPSPQVNSHEASRALGALRHSAAMTA